MGCRKVGAKKELLRIVRTPDGDIKVDETGKLGGRGAYLHRDPVCWSHAVRHGALERALKAELSDSARLCLESYEGSLPPSQPVSC